MFGDELLRSLDERDNHVYWMLRGLGDEARRAEVHRRLVGLYPKWSMASDTLTRCLRSLQGEGLVHQAATRGKYALGAGARFWDFQLYGWAEKTVEHLTRWAGTGILDDKDIGSLVLATQLRKQLDDRYAPHPLMEILNKMPMKRTMDPEIMEVPGKGNLGVSPEKAEELLGEIGMERSPLVRELRGR